MHTANKRFVWGRLFILTAGLLLFGCSKRPNYPKKVSEPPKNQIEDTMRAAFKSWQEFPVVPVASLDQEKFNSALAVEIVGIPAAAHIDEFKQTAFNLIKSYNSESSQDFLRFWSWCDWSIDTNAAPELKRIAGEWGTNGEANVSRLWYKGIANNRIMEISLSAMYAEVSWTSDIDKLVSEKYRQDISRLSPVKIPPVIAVGLSRSLFYMEPSASKIIETDGKVLYGRLILFVKYSQKGKNGESVTIPLALGFYWSPTENRWIPHTKGIISSVDPMGIVF